VPPSEIKPCIQATQKDGQDENKGTGNFYINDLLYIMNDERACVGNERRMFRPQPDLEMGKGTVPVEYLNDESKSKA